MAFELVSWHVILTLPLRNIDRFPLVRVFLPPRRRMGMVGTGMASAGPSPSETATGLSMLPLVALVTAGLEDPAIEEIQERFGLAPGGVRLVCVPPPEDNWTPEAQGGIFAGASGVSKLQFEVPWPADEAALHHSIRSLKGAQSILAPVALATVSLDAKQGLLDARATISDGALWPPALEAWRVLTERGAPGAAPSSFRCSSVRDGPSGYTSVELASAVRSELPLDLG